MHPVHRRAMQHVFGCTLPRCSFMALFVFHVPKEPLRLDGSLLCLWP